MRKIGVHISIAGGMDKAIIRASHLGINALQVFLKNNNRWKGKDYSTKEIEDYFGEITKNPDMSIFAHSGYLINLAGEGEPLEKSLWALKDEITRAEQLHIDYLVLHPGNHKGKGISAGIEEIARSIDTIYDESGSKVTILLETTAGQGTSIGHRFQELRDIIDCSHYPEKLGICLDTCHIFAAGYDIATRVGYNKTIEDFEKYIGIEKLHLIHVNDSKKECGSRIDRHEHIGEGKIGDEGFYNLLHDIRLKHVPLILETPKFNNDEADIMNLKKIQKIIEEKK